MRIIRPLITLMAFGLAMPCNAIFEHDSAVYAGQKDAWPKAMELMKKAVANHPADATVLYDAGVASYRIGDFAQALAYFHQAAETTPLSSSMQERAHFNEGNAHAHLKQYQDAVTCYEKVLVLNPDNQQARDNLALMKKLLEKQQQEQQKDKNDKQQQDDKENDDQDDQQQDNDQQGQTQDNQDDQEGDQEQKNAGNDGGDTTKRGDKQGNAQHKQSQQQDQQSEKSKNQQQQQQQEVKKEQQEKEAYAQQADGNEKNTPQVSSPSPQPVDAWLDKLLSEREQGDAALNKKLVKARADRQSKGQQDARADW